MTRIIGALLCWNWRPSRFFPAAIAFSLASTVWCAGLGVLPLVKPFSGPAWVSAVVAFDSFLAALYCFERGIYIARCWRRFVVAKRQEGGPRC